MCPEEVWIFIDAKTPEKRYGRMTQSEVEALYQLHEQLEASEEDGTDSKPR
jgi:hypothetical protein